jgi:hypothetical protein
VVTTGEVVYSPVIYSWYREYIRIQYKTSEKLFKTLVALYNDYSTNVVQRMLICAVIHFSDDLVKVNDQVSNPRNSLAQFPVYARYTLCKALWDGIHIFSSVNGKCWHLQLCK